MTTTSEHHSVPLYAKMIITIQFLVNVFLGFWMYQEYTYNIFFQAYVNAFVNDNMLVLVSLCAVIGFLGTGLGMYVKSHGKTSSIGLAIENGNTANKPHEPSMKGGKLDTHTEQQLIDMIRKTVPVSSGGTSTSASPTGQSLPTLQRLDDNKKP